MQMFRRGYCAIITFNSQCSCFTSYLEHIWHHSNHTAPSVDGGCFGRCICRVFTNARMLQRKGLVAHQLLFKLDLAIDLAHFNFSMYIYSQLYKNMHACSSLVIYITIATYSCLAFLLHCIATYLYTYVGLLIITICN